MVTALVASLVLVLVSALNLFTARGVLIGAILFRLGLLWLPPGLSDDAYRYIWDGRVTVAGMNPYLDTPASLADAGVIVSDEVYSALNSKSVYTVYPPVSQYFFAAGGVIEKVTRSWKGSYYFLKILFVILELVGVALLCRMVAPALALLYAWNPVVLVETAGQMHTESLLVFLLVAAIYYFRNGKHTLSATLFGLAVWVKLYPIFLIPLLARRIRIRSLAIGGGICAVIAVPFLDANVVSNVADSLDLYVRSFEFNAGFYYAIKEAAFHFGGSDYSKTIGPVLRNVFFVLAIGVYLIDWRRQWKLERSSVWILGLFLILATTVHPWYFLGLLAVIPLATARDNYSLSQYHWNWYAAAALSLGTYLLYTNGSSAYWGFVVATWTVWLVVTLIAVSGRVQDQIMKHRARQKYLWIRRCLQPDYGQQQVLDLGTGEGYLGDLIATRNNANVALVDVVDYGKSKLPVTVYDGATIPWPDGAFRTSILYFVLHHTENPEAVLDEAIRVTARDIIIVESTYKTVPGRAFLTLLDRLANRFRSGEKMSDQLDHVAFRRDEEWRILFNQRGLEVLDVKTRGVLVHHQVFYHLQKKNTEA